MHIKSILTAAAIALVAGLGSASAADQFTALEGITAEPLNAVELDRVRGASVGLGGLDGVPPHAVHIVAINTTRMRIDVCPPSPVCFN